jgi:transcriptional regulator with XRE-family HTH domain
VDPKSIRLQYLGQKVRLRRESLGYTKQQIEEACELGNGTVTRIENNENTTVNTILKIAEYLKINPKILFDDSIRLPNELMDLPNDQRDFLLSDDFMPYLQLAKYASDKGLSPETIKQLMNIIAQEKNK